MTIVDAGARKELEVRVGGTFRDQEDECHADWSIVRCVERDWHPHAKERAYRVAQTFDSAMGNRDALSQPGGAQAFAGQETVDHLGAAQARDGLQHGACTLEQRLLVGCIDIKCHLRRLEQGGDQTHRSRRSGTD